MESPLGIDVLLATLPGEDRDRLFPLLAEGPRVVEELTGSRPHRSLLYRHARRGVYGQRLRTVAMGRTLMSTRRWLMEHWAAIALARRTVEAPPTPCILPTTLSGHVNAVTAEEAETLRRHGVGPKDEE